FTAASPPATSTLSLHDALPIWPARGGGARRRGEQQQERDRRPNEGTRFPLSTLRHSAPHEYVGPLESLMSTRAFVGSTTAVAARSEEHTSELQSRGHLVCRLLL